MLRMARARQSDPAIANDAGKTFYGRQKPELDVDFCRLSVERLAEVRWAKNPVRERGKPTGDVRVGAMVLKYQCLYQASSFSVGAANCDAADMHCRPFCQELPNYEARRALLARDPLACAYGFQVLVLLALRHIFGLRFCFHCPDCAASSQPCTDAFGSNATAAGGAFGRIDAVYGSLECQRCGAFHMHGQFFVQCFHQFRSLGDLMELGQERMLEMLRKYSDYSAHVSRKVYCNPEAWHDKQHEIEEQWPEYKASSLMQSRPGYQQDEIVTPAEWRRIYLAEDVEALQMHKQHHVHIMDQHGRRQPLNHCKDPKDPTKCKAHFPRDRWLTEEPYFQGHLGEVLATYHLQAPPMRIHHPLVEAPQLCAPRRTPSR